MSENAQNMNCRWYEDLEFQMPSHQGQEHSKFIISP